MQNSPHAALHTAANLSHIRVALKDDTLGLGARPIGEEIATTGLDGLQSLLGRLNGKTEDVLDKEKSLREEVRRGDLLQKRFGGGLERFVSGGWLVGDVIREGNEEGVVEKDVGDEGEGRMEAVKKEKKRKRSEQRKDGRQDPKVKCEESTPREGEVDGRSKTSVKECKFRRTSVKDGTPDKEGQLETRTKVKRQKKEEEEQEREELNRQVTRVKKDKKKKKSANNKQQQEAKEEVDEAEPTLHPTSHDLDQDQDPDPSDPATPMETLPPVTSPPVTPSTADGMAILEGRRNMLRRRHIRQKQLAVRDARALKEVCHL